jgi:hypothetical protein
MPERNTPPEDEQSLAKSVNEQQLARPVSGEQEEASQEEQQTSQAEGEQEEARRVESGRKEATRAEEKQEGKGLVDKIKDKLTGW